MRASAMRAALHAVLLVGALLASREAMAYCVRNALPDASVRATVIALKGLAVPKLFAETVGPGREFCCNPKNADCNPDRIGDEGFALFEAEVRPPGAQGAAVLGIKCGVVSSADPRKPPLAHVAIPVRGFLRFDRNPRFDVRRRPASDNPPYLLQALTADNRISAVYPCPARGVNETPRS
jgi:hypothetical protein